MHMKQLLVIAAMTVSSVALANTAVSNEELAQHSVQDVSVLLAQGGQFGTVNDGQSVEKGQIIVGENGLSAYKATGEVIIELATFADADKVAAAHGLTLKQAYKSFYVVTSSQTNLTEVVNTLREQGTVISADLGLIDLGTKVN